MFVPLEYNFVWIGLLLIAVEFIVPGISVFGILGLLTLTVGSYFILGGGMEAFLILATVYAVVGALVLLLCFYLPSESKWNPFVLWDKQKNDAGYTGSRDFSGLLHKVAVAVTPLRPSGTVLLEGERLDVSSFGDYIDKGETVVITKIEGSKIFVKKYEGDEVNV